MTSKTLHNVKKAVAPGIGTDRKFGNVGATQKWISQFLDAYQPEIEQDPTRLTFSLRKMVNQLNQNPNITKTAVNTA